MGSGDQISSRCLGLKSFNAVRRTLTVSKEMHHHETEWQKTQAKGEPAKKLV
jgi:hypothetical protein